MRISWEGKAASETSPRDSVSRRSRSYNCWLKFLEVTRYTIKRYLGHLNRKEWLRLRGGIVELVVLVTETAIILWGIFCSKYTQFVDCTEGNVSFSADFDTLSTI